MPAGSQFHACTLFPFRPLMAQAAKSARSQRHPHSAASSALSNERILRPAAYRCHNDAKPRDPNDRSQAQGTGVTLINNVKRWGRWSTLGLGLIAALVGQMAALAALIWWYGLDLAQLLDLAGDGVAVTLMVCTSTPVQVLLLALMARQAGANAA